MSAVENKRVMQGIYAEMAKGNGRPLVESLADDISWTICGTTPWSKTYRGRKAVIAELLAPLTEQFADQYTNTAHRFIAEDDYVVVECRGRVTTKTGKAYNNSYCNVYRLSNGKIVELTEYLDTALVDHALLPPPSPSIG
jgi:uncharacterized protein